jgi:type IV pilus assembly protein PilF
MLRTGLLAVVISLLLAACGGLPVDDERAGQIPVSQQPVVGEARRAAKAHTDLGMVYLREGQLPVALEEARRAIDSDSSYPLAYNLLGVVQMYLDENPAAEEAFGRAIQMAPNEIGRASCRERVS